MDAKKTLIFFICTVLLVTPFALKYYEEMPVTPWLTGAPMKYPACAADQNTTVLELIKNNANLPKNHNIQKEVNRAIDQNQLIDDEVLAYQCIEINRYPFPIRWKQHKLVLGENPYALAKTIKRPDYVSFEDILLMIMVTNSITEETAPNIPIETILLLPEYQLQP